MPSQDLWSSLHSRHFPQDTVSPCVSMAVRHILTLMCGDIKHVIRNVRKVVWAVGHVICQTFSSSIKTCVTHIPMPFLLSTSGTLNGVDTCNHVSSRRQDPQPSVKASGNYILQY